MQARGVILMVVSIVAGLGITSAGQQANPQSASVLVGETRVTTSPDGLTAIVSIDLAGDTSPADGLVDQAFRIQLPAPASFNFAGPATVVYAANRLTVGWNGSVGWTFVVAGTTAKSRMTERALSEVIGLARFWGPSVHLSHEEVASRLLSSGCSASSTSLLVQPLSAPSCSDCVSGGAGQTGCSVGCNETGGCSADCSDGYSACCTCGSGCRCCRQ